MRRFAFSLALLSCVLFGAATASALTYSPSVMFEVVGGTGQMLVNDYGYGVDGGEVYTWNLSAPLAYQGAMIESWQAQFKEDPFVTNNFVVTNTTAFTQTFIASVLLPIPAFGYDSIVFSSIGITTTDSNGNNVLSFDQSGATSVYQGQVNGVTVLSLGNGGLPLTTANCLPFPGVPGCSATASDGVPLAGIPAGPAVANSIGIIVSFELSPGDSAGITSRFEVIPEPTTAVLLALGLAGLAFRRRA